MDFLRSILNPRSASATLVLLATLAPAPRLSADDFEDGQSLAAELRQSRPTQPVDVQGVIRRRNAEGYRTNIPFHYRLILGSNEWRSVYETTAVAGLGPQKLTVRHAENEANQYRLESTPAGGTEALVTNLTGPGAMVSFAGSDFWLADLGLDFLHWPQHRIVEEVRIRMRKGRPCQILESRNPAPDAQGYNRVISWIDRETGKPIIAEAYAPDGRLLKEFEVGGVTKVGGVWELKNLEIRNLREDSRTILEFTYHQKE